MHSTELPEYARIKRKLVSEIESGQWQVGSAIPSETQLSVFHNVSRATVVRSLQELALEGYLFRQKGRGTFVADFRRREQRGSLPIPLFIYEGTYRLSGSGRQVLLRILAGIEETLGPAHPGVSIRQVPAKLDDATRRMIDETKPGVSLVVEPSFNTALVDYLQRAGSTTWVVNEPVDNSNCVYVNQERAGYLATEYLLSQGRQRIALLNGPINGYWGFAARYRGYVAALTEAGIQLDAALHRQGQHSIDSEAGRAMLRGLLDERVVFDGVVGVTDSKAMGAMALAEERGIVVPRDLVFVSIDDTIADQSEPPLSAVALPFEEMGRQVALRALEAEQRLSSERVSVPSPRGTQPTPLQQVALQPFLVRRPGGDLAPRQVVRESVDVLTHN